MFKKLLKLIAIVVVVLLVVIVALLLFDNDSITTEAATLKPEQKRLPTPEYIEQEDSLRYDALFEEFGANKIFPEGFELQTLVALSHYPQLKDTHIEFILTDTKGSLYSQPEFSSVLLPWKKRRYQVIIDTIKVQDFVRPTLLENLPYNAQIGVIGHELAHTISYLDKPSIKLSWTAIRYQSSEKYLEEFENDTDLRTIDHGLGYQLLSWSRFQHHIKIQEGKGERYLSPQQIEDVLHKHSLYIP